MPTGSRLSSSCRLRTTRARLPGVGGSTRLWTRRMRSRNGKPPHSSRAAPIAALPTRWSCSSRNSPADDTRKTIKRNGERGRNRTYNLLIKSQLLCQLSYAPTVGNLPAGQFVIVTFSAARVIDAFSWRTTHESIERYSITHESADRIAAGARRSSSRARSQRTALRRTTGRLRTLPYFRSQSAWIFADHRTTRRQGVGPHSWPFLDSANHRSVLKSVGVSHRHEPLLGAQTIDHPLLAVAKHGVRKNGKVPEHPNEVHPLKE